MQLPSLFLAHATFEYPVDRNFDFLEDKLRRAVDTRTEDGRLGYKAPGTEGTVDSEVDIGVGTVLSTDDMFK